MILTCLFTLITILMGSCVYIKVGIEQPLRENHSMIIVDYDQFSLSIKFDPQLSQDLHTALCKVMSVAE